MQNYILQLGRQIATYIQGGRFPFIFSVVAGDSCDGTHDPAALPGGYVFVSAQLLAAVQNEAELAGMLAHALAHSVPPSSMTVGSGWSALCPAGATVPVGYLARQRSAELQADGLAVQVMARSGFDPDALLRYVERTQAPAPPGAISRVFSAVPDRNERVAALRAAIAKLPVADYASTSPADFTATRREALRLAAPPERSGEPPSLLRKNR